ncbi:MAG: DDE-type integrase/transposase/recombinase [Clostridia bacterium]|nr:DDE-type integrase/transposase/recombinase [Clostridia bacterium]
MNYIISCLINFLNRINKIIWKFILFLSKFIKVEEVSNRVEKPADERYRRFKVDEPPIIEKVPSSEKKDYKQLIKVNNIKPIKRRNGKYISINVSCPCCNAPKDYLYDNNGKQSQFECKVCSHIFSTNPNKQSDINFLCPHCNYKLSLKHSRSDFDVYVCPNKKCSYFLDNLKHLSKEDAELFAKNPSIFKLHYTYRKFNIDVPAIRKDFKQFLSAPIDISKAYHSMHVIGLCLTYHVNYGLSYRQTSAILKDIHCIDISYKTVENYCKSVSSIVQYLLEFYPYQLSDSLCADETYIKVLGKTQYIFFYFDSIKKIVTSYRVFEHRDTLASLKAAYSTLVKYDKLPESLKVITDGNPIYNVAVQYWTQHGMPFQLYQVIGLKNLDDTSKQYRSSKQIIERHNRTLKYYYRPKNGFTSNQNANNYMVLFATCFNFLRPHSALNYHVPVEISEVQSCKNMPSKWIKLISLSYDYIKANA